MKALGHETCLTYVQTRNRGVSREVVPLLRNGHRKLFQSPEAVLSKPMSEETLLGWLTGPCVQSQVTQLK